MSKPRARPPLQNIYILYNADATVLGKLRYAYRKLRSPSPACAACDLTHGGLSLKETSNWVDARRRIEETWSCKVIQWHRDEINKEVKHFIGENRVTLPAVIAVRKEDDSKETFMTILDRSGLNECRGDPIRLENALDIRLKSTQDDKADGKSML